MRTKNHRQYQYDIDVDLILDLLRRTDQTQTSLAQLIGVSPSTIWHSMRTRSMTLPVIIKICKVYELEPEAFVNEDIDDYLLWKWG